MFGILNLRPDSDVHSYDLRSFLTACNNSIVGLSACRKEAKKSKRAYPGSPVSDPPLGDGECLKVHYERQESLQRIADLYFNVDIQIRNMLQAIRLLVSTLKSKSAICGKLSLVFHSCVYFDGECFKVHGLMRKFIAHVAQLD